MERYLRQLFDYQKFQQNSRLDAMLEKAEGRCAQALTDEDLEWVSAAGTDQNLFWQDPNGSVGQE